MSWLNRRALYALGAVTLVGSALAIAANEPGPASKEPGPASNEPGPASKVEVSTVGSEPAALTAAELGKLLELELVRVTPATVVTDGAAPAPVAEKAAEVSTIVVGTPGPTAQELAKLQGVTAPPAAEPQATNEQE